MNQFFGKQFQRVNKTYLNSWIILGMDLFIAMICSCCAYLGIHYITDSVLIGTGLLFVTVSAMIAELGGDLLFGTYQNIIRYSKAGDLWRVICCVLFKICCMIVVVFFILRNEHLLGRQKLMFVVFDGMLTLICMVGIRILMIVIYESLCRTCKNESMRILIYGLDDKSVALETRLRDSSHYNVIGFYVDTLRGKSKRLCNLPVYSSSNENEFMMLIEKRNVQGILFSRYEVTKDEENRLLQFCKRKRVKTLIAPTISEADEEGKFHQTVRPIKIEDLLGREEININIDDIKSEFSEKVILVTGAAGSIGSELCRQLANLNVKKLILFDSAETPLHNIRLEFETKYPKLDFAPIIGDVRVKQRVRMVFEQYHPQIVFHAAAYKHVPLMEENPCEAVLVNVTGTCQVADMALRYGVEKMIMISTDKAVNPTNIMGASKRLAEIYVQSLGCAIKEGKVNGSTKFVTTRFGNVLGSNGSVIPRFKEQIENGGPVTVTHPDIIRFFMTIPEACRLVMEAATMGKGNEIFVFDMGKPVRIVDLATKMIELAGYKLNVDIKIEYTGLRPGEKLFEEVLSTRETTLPTSNSKIQIAKVRHYKYDEILGVYDQFEQLSRDVDVVKTVMLMKQVVPEFISQNSRFEELDHATKIVS